MPAELPPAPARTTSEDQGERDELRAGSDGDERDPERCDSPQRRRARERAHEHGEGAEEDRVGERLGEQVRVVDERGRGDGRRRSQERVAGPDELPREPVGRKDRRAHDDRVQRLRERVGRPHVPDEPRGRLRDAREERREEHGLPADAEALAGCERPRELRVEKLVREDRRRHVERGLERVVDRREDEEDGKRGRGPKTRARPRLGAGEVEGRLGVARALALARQRVRAHEAAIGSRYLAL